MRGDETAQVGRLGVGADIAVLKAGQPARLWSSAHLGEALQLAAAQVVELGQAGRPRLKRHGSDGDEP